MKEQSIIMTAESVRKILAGTKTHTRRVFTHTIGNVSKFLTLEGDVVSPQEMLNRRPGNAAFLLGSSPYGVIGGRVWVRESWCELIHGEKAMYRADIDKYAESIQWNRAIHMPRWASRIMLEITGINLQRVQEMTREDAIAEGMTREERWNCYGTGSVEKDAYAELWDSLNAKRGYSWAKNPWVWVIKFKQVKE